MYDKLIRAIGEVLVGIYMKEQLFLCALTGFGGCKGNEGKAVERR